MNEPVTNKPITYVQLSDLKLPGFKDGDVIVVVESIEKLN